MSAARASIRPLTATDFDGWLPLWQAYLTFYDSTLPVTVTEHSFARLTDPQARERGGFVATVDGELVGLVHYIFHAHNWRIEEVCYLQDLYVAPKGRGMGTGRALIEAVYAMADDKGCPSVYWMTQEFNATARALYDRVATKTPFIKYQR